MGSQRKMKVGVFLPVTEREHGGGTASWTELRAMAAQVEAAGFDSIWIEDHLLFRFDDGTSQGHANAGRSWPRWPPSPRGSSLARW